MSSTLYTCISSDSVNYGNAVLRFTPVDNAEYKVVAVNMKADFLVTAKEDEVIFHYPSEQKDLVLTFENKSDYQLSTLVDYLNSIMPSDPDVGKITVSMSSEGCLIFTGQYPFEIYYADHRARLLLGLINYTPPEDPTNKIYAPETPNVCLGNFLQLYSREGRVIMTENIVGEQEIVIDKSPSILSVFNTFTMPHIPLILTKKNGSLIPLKVRTHQISEIHMSLVDKYNQPVILLTPMTVVIKIKSLPNLYVQPKTASPKRT